MKIYPQKITDQIGHSIELLARPKRIISLVPSQTELLHYLLEEVEEEEVVGITKFCVHPEKWYRSKTRIGGTKDYHFDRIHDLKPDLIIANKEENDKDSVEALAEQYPVWTSDIGNLEQALEMIQSLGDLLEKGAQAQQLCVDIEEAFRELKSEISTVNKKRKVAYLIWREPYMVAGGDTFINDILTRSGFENIFGNKKRYPQTDLEELKSMGLDMLLLSSEPFPFKEKHLVELEKQLPDVKVMLVDGEMFSWYGSRLLEVPDYVRREIG